MFYGIDSSRVTLAEYRWGTPWYGMPLIALLKLLRVRIPSSTDDPNVEALHPFEIGGDALPDETREQLLPLARELEPLGFRDPVLHAIFDPTTSTRIYWATFRHVTGRAIARLHRRVWSAAQPPRTRQFPVFLSAFADGSYRVTSAGKPDLAPPPEVETEHVTGAGTSALWERHCAALDTAASAGRETIALIDDPVLHGVLERHHATVRDFHLARGVFQRPKEEERSSTLEAARAIESAELRGERYAEEIAELAKLEKDGVGWVGGLVLLAVSLAFFVGLGGARWSWDFVLMLVGILFVHELGHFVAMRAFDYRNVRMFFIPLFGAAVMGRNPQAAGWKRVLVSLAGPLPGILLALPLGLAGATADLPVLVETARLALLLNAFNLLPLLPLDGGWVMHALVFCRHPHLDIAARLMAALGLFGLALTFGDSILAYLTIPILLGLPANWKVARAAADLKKERLALDPGPDGLPPRAALERVFDRLTAPPAKPAAKKLLAQQAASVLDSLGAEPPGALVTTGLLLLYGFAFVAAIVIFVVLVVAGGA